MAKQDIGKQTARLAGAAIASAGLVGAAWLLDALRRDRWERQMHRKLVDLLLNALTADDPVTARHSRRVADLAFALGAASGRLDRDEMATLRVAALLHDMGKIDDRFFVIVHSRKPLSEERFTKVVEDALMDNMDKSGLSQQITVGDLKYYRAGGSVGGGKSKFSPQ